MGVGLPVYCLRVHTLPLRAELGQVPQDLARMLLAPAESCFLSAVVDDPAEDRLLDVPFLLLRGCETEPLAIGWHSIRSFLFCFSQICSHKSMECFLIL